MADKFDAAATLVKLRAKQAAKRKRTLWHRNAMAQRTGEMLQLRHEGASYAMIADWLKTVGVSKSKSAVMRYLKKYG